MESLPYQGSPDTGAAALEEPEQNCLFDDSCGLTVFRVSVLGASGCGKTSLVSAFVNNGHPAVHVPTVKPVLFYKTIGLTLAPRVATVVNEPQAVPLDIIEGNEFRSKDHRRFDTVAESLINQLMDEVVPTESVAEVVPMLVELQDTEGLSTPDATSSLQGNVRGTQSIPRGRMGYLIVFDPASKTSFFEAQRLLESFLKEREDSANGGSVITQAYPVLYLVASRMDKASNASEATQILQTAGAYAKGKNLKFETLAVTDLKKVRRLFHTLCRDIYAQPALWKTRKEEEKSIWEMATDRFVDLGLGTSAVQNRQPKDVAVDGQVPAVLDMLKPPCLTQ